MKYRHFPFEIARTIVFLVFIAPAGYGLAQPTTNTTDAGARANSVAYLLAGFKPSLSAHADLARRDVWKKYSSTLQTSWRRLRKKQVAPLTAWRNANLPQNCPAGTTLLYPFSGPDFFNAYWLFPECETVVMFGLEDVGGLPPVETMSEAQFGRLLAGLREAMANILARNYFVTSRMRKNLHADEVRGVLPILMISMAFSGVEIVRVAPIVLDPPAASEATPPCEAASDAKTPCALKGVTIEFHRPGSQRLQRLHYFSVDVTNKHLAGYPQFIDYIKGLSPTTTLLKSASYLLHTSRFKKIRAAILDASAYILQDDTGIPYPMLVKAGWETRVFGRYLVPISPFEFHYQQALADAFETQRPDPLPFRFGYFKTGLKEDRSNVIIAARAAAGLAASDSTVTRRPAPLKQ